MGRQSAHVLDRVAEIAPILDRTAAESERLRTLCREATDAMHAAGLFGMWVPREAGGFDIDLVTQVEAIVELARADMSACWTVMIGNTVTASMAASLPAEGFAEVFVGEGLPVAAGSLKPSGRAERVAGGYRATGQWGFGSGILHAEWIVANCLTEDQGQTQGISLAVPIAEVEVHDDWHVAGLRGTGSCTYAVTDVFVPDRRALCAARQRGSFFNAAAGLRIPIEHAAVSLGGARRALDETIRLSATKRRLWDSATVADKQTFRVELGRLEAEWRTLLAGVRASAADLEHAVEREGDVRGVAAKLKAVAALAAEQCLAIGGRALRYAGAAAIQDDGVLQRVHRDLVAAAQHVMVADVAYEAYGDSVLGAGAGEVTSGEDRG